MNTAAALKRNQDIPRRAGRLSLRGLRTSIALKLFGCRHRDMSRPFTHGGESYRTCLSCGARRAFDTEKWEMTGPFYYER